MMFSSSGDPQRMEGWYLLGLIKGSGLDKLSGKCNFATYRWLN